MNSNQENLVTEKGSDTGGLSDAQQQIKDYLMRCGVIPEEGITSKDRAAALQKKREDNYLNISSLLENYRSLLRTYILFQKEFEEEIADHAPTETTYDLNLFDKLCQQLDILSVTEEKKFQKHYARHIINGRRIGVALKALHFGLEVLKAESPEMYQIIHVFYIRGNSKPTFRAAMEELGFLSHSSYYHKVEQAKRRLSILVFGFADKRDELMDALIHLRQQADDDYFPDYDCIYE